VKARKPITIVGGGLAGLTLGIGLRQRGIPVVIWEAGHYPRHRVCGEFISGEGQEVLSRMGLRDLVIEAGAIRAQKAVFFDRCHMGPVRPLVPPALSISRFALDHAFAQALQRAGGELRQNSKWQGDCGEGVVRASGRRVQKAAGDCHWFGLKVHARKVELAADLEMHSLPDGYVGLARLSSNEVNVCGLFRRFSHGQPATSQPAGAGTRRSWKEVLSGPPGSALHSRLARAEFDEASFCSVAGLDLEPQIRTEEFEIRVGDALTMIPPVTGNGMSMAFEAAEIASRHVAAYSLGELSWPETRHRLARECRHAFARRLRWARWLQRLMFATSLQPSVSKLLLCSDTLWRIFFSKTR